MKQKYYHTSQTYRLIRLFIVLFIVLVYSVTQAQTITDYTISGTVKDVEGSESLPGVSVTAKGTTTGTVTDLDGNFSITVSRGTILVFSYIGFEPYELITTKNQSVQIRLKAMVASLDEVVVIGYGNTTKKEVTGSISTVKSDGFNRGAFNNPMGLLQGKVAGLTIVKPNGADPMAGYNIILRGTNTLTSGQGPLIIIDGVIGAEMKNISPEEIESMDVLKDGAAAAIYGTRGSNGVIIITTKRAKSGLSKVEYSGLLSVQVAPRGVENLSAAEFRQAIEQYAPDKTGSIYDANTDWFGEITRSTPFSQKHNLA